MEHRFRVCHVIMGSSFSKYPLLLIVTNRRVPRDVITAPQNRCWWHAGRRTEEWRTTVGFNYTFGTVIKDNKERDGRKVCR